MKTLEQYGTPTEVANDVGKPRNTLRSAVERGEIDYARTYGGSLLIDVESARAWITQTRKRGPKPKAKP